jgi:hypothetical protein
MTSLARLKLLDPRLQQVLRESTDEGRRRVALTVSSLAIDRAGITDPRLAAGLERLQRGGYGDSPERGAVQALTEELDEVAWDIQDQADGADNADYAKAFMKARAANALWYALDEDPLEAAAEAAYEAGAAIEDPQSLRTAVEDVLK